VTQVEYHLKVVIWRWCGADPSKYVVDSFLRDIFEANVPGVPYEPEGVRRFFQTLYADPFFLNCPAAHQMSPLEFLKGGDLQSVRQVYRRLLPCGNLPINPADSAQFGPKPTPSSPKRKGDTR
jgi:hypothetical protein